MPRVQLRNKNPKGVTAEIEALEHESKDALRERWREHYGAPSPPRISRKLLTYAIAYKIQEKESNFRLVMTQDKWEAPAYYQDAQDYTKVPRLVVWADTTTMGVFPFVDSLVSESFESDQKKELLKELEIFNNDPSWEPLVQRGKKSRELGGEKAIHWTGQVSYTMNVSLSSSSAGGKRVKGKYGSTIVAVKKENTIVFFYMMCEWDYYQQIDSEISAIINSLTWVGENKKG